MVYIASKNDKIMNASGTAWVLLNCSCDSITIITVGSECVAYLDTLHSTVCHNECDLLIVPGECSQRCNRCVAYRGNLRSLSNRHVKQAADSSRTNAGSHAAFSRLSSPEKCERYHHEHALHTVCQRQITNLHKNAAVTEERGFSLHSSLNDDLVQIMKDNAEAVCTVHPPGTFGRVFFGKHRCRLLL